MSRQRLTAVALVMYLLAPMLAHAQDVTALIPGDTYGFVLVTGLTDPAGKIQAMGQRMKLPIPSLVPNKGAQDETIAGVDHSRPIALVLLPTDQGPTLVLYVPVNDYAAFIEQLGAEDTDRQITPTSLMGQPVIVGDKSDHAVITWPGNQALLQKMLSEDVPPQGVTAAVKAMVGKHDVTAVLTSSGVRMLTALGLDGLEKLKANMRETLGEDNPALAGIEVYVHILAAIDSEVASAAVGLKLEEEGSLRVREQVWVRPSGKIAPIIRDIKPYDGDLLSGLPKTPYVIAFGGVIPAAAMQPMMNFSENLMKAMPELYGLSAEQIDEMMEMSIKYLPDLHGMSFLLGVGQEDTPLYSEMLGAMHVRDAPGYISSYREFWAELDEVIGDAEGSFFQDATLEEVNLDGIPVLKISMPIPEFQGLNMPNQNELDVLMEKFYGPGGLTMYLAAADDDTVLMAYTDTALLREALRIANDEPRQFSQDQNIVSTSRQLPTSAHAIGYWSPAGTIAFVNRMLQLVSGPEAGVRLPVFPQTPPVGWTITVTPEVVTTDTVIPAEIFEALGPYVQQVQRRVSAGAADET